MSTAEELSAYTEDEDEVFEDEDKEDADGWGQEPLLSRRPRRRLLTPLTALLFAILVGAGGFIAGVQVEKGEVPASSASAGGGRFAALSARSATGRSSATAASGGFGAGGLAGAGATVGQVANISGSNLYVTELQGNTIEVAASAAQITKQVSTSIRGVHPGDTVVIQGAHRSDGSILAATVRDSGNSSAAAGGIGALFGAGGSSGGTPRAGSNSAGGGEPTLFGK
jgi:hypothetical protein